MSGSFESVQWKACVHRLDLSLYSYPKDFWGNGVRTHVNSTEKNPLYWKNSPQRRIEPTMLHQAEQPAHHTTNKLFQLPRLWTADLQSEQSGMDWCMHTEKSGSFTQGSELGLFSGFIVRVKLLMSSTDCVLFMPWSISEARP